MRPYLNFALIVLAVAAAGWAEGESTEQLASELADLLGHEFRVHTSPHFVVVYDTDEAFARRRGTLLERAHEQFYDTFERAGLSPRPIERRLVCILFREFDDYARYAAAVDGELLAFTGGYYSHNTGRVAFHDDRTSPQFDETGRKIDELETQIALLRRRIEEVRRAGDPTGSDERRLRELRREHRWLSNRLDVIAAGSNDAKTTHEAVHQLAFASGVQNPAVQYPLWVTEGMAMCFEAPPGTGAAHSAGGRGFGPYHDNLWRRKLLIQTHMRGGLVGLAQFAAMMQVPEQADHRAATEIYAQSWGLFRFLFSKRNEHLCAYLKVLSTVPPGERSADTMRAEFEAAFGSIPKTEREFSAYLRSIR